MSRVHIYTVHINPSLPQPYEAVEFVEEGFNWKAFIFSGFWALYNKLWWSALGIFAYNAFMAQLLSSHTFSHTGVGILQLGLELFIGFQANDWRRTNLKKRGFITADVVTGDSLIRAEQRFFDRYFSTRSSAAFSQ